MSQEFQPITLQMPFKLGAVNCYLIKTASGFVLIDTGSSNQRVVLDRALEDAGCQAGDLDLIVLTHGDFDHIGNCTYLREKHAAKVAMHRDDSDMAERGDMFYNRQSGNPVMKALAPILFRFPKSYRFRADLYIEDDYDLAEYGFDAQALSIPGHSKGSLGILTSDGVLFCGDLLENIKGPALNSIMDDPPTANASLDKLAGYEIHTVYPGHGQPFSFDSFVRNR